MGQAIDDNEFAGVSGEYLEENRRARLNLIREAQSAMEMLRRAEDKANEDGMEPDKRGTDIPTG